MFAIRIREFFHTSAGGLSEDLAKWPVRTRDRHLASRRVSAASHFTRRSAQGRNDHYAGAGRDRRLPHRSSVQ
jgi:hypothetical protein